MPNLLIIFEKYSFLEKPIIVHIDQQVMTIGINRPKQKNSLDLSTAQYLTDALNAFEENKEVLIGILHGVGGNFCSGYDLFQIAKHHGKKDLPQFGPLVNQPRRSSIYQ